MEYAYDETVELGRGGMAVVYRARNRGSGAVVALKRPLPYPEARADERLRREIKVLTLIDHPNVIPVLDHGEDEAGEPWYAMPLADYSLSKYWEEAPFHEDAETVCADLLEDICAGLRAMHEVDYVHRDVTPSNILGFRDSGRRSGYRWVIADCGLARPALGATTTGLTGSVSELGTRGYMAPECYGAPHLVTNAADVYSLGRVMARLLTDTKPVLTQELLPSGMWRPVIRDFTRSDPLRRPQSMDAALERAQALLAPLPTSAKIDFRTQIDTKGGKLAPDNGLWDVVEDHLDDHDFMIDDLVLIATSAARRLAAQRPARAVSIAERLAEHLSTGQWTDGRSYDVANRHLDWVKAVLEGLIDAGRLDLFGDLAPAYCQAVVDCDRYPHNGRLRTWLVALGGEWGTTMARAIQQAGVAEYMRRVADGRRMTNPALAAVLAG